MKESIHNFLKVANFMADEARKISMKYFKKQLIVRTKDLNSFDPVTIADTKVQSKINEIVKNYFPKHSILGEEASIETISDYEWCIDPIDGTKSFIQGFPIWGTLISLSNDVFLIILSNKELIFDVSVINWLSIRKYKESGEYVESFLLIRSTKEFLVFSRLFSEYSVTIELY